MSHYIGSHAHCQVLTHDIHFWIGGRSTADKYGTAAYKSVELYNHVSLFTGEVSFANVL